MNNTEYAYAAAKFLLECYGLSVEEVTEFRLEADMTLHAEVVKRGKSSTLTTWNTYKPLNRPKPIEITLTADQIDTISRGRKLK